MKKLTTLLSASIIFVTALLSNPALAYTDAVMPPQESHDTAVKIKILTYSCQSKKKVVVQYGFNKQNLPTYAQAYLDGKVRFLPINLGRSDNVDTVFGDEKNFNIMSNTFNLSNYTKSSINIQNVSSEILYKNCVAKK